MTKKTGTVPGSEQRSTTEPVRAQPTDRRRDGNNLTVRYGSIGISAVAAALRYTDCGKNPAYAPVVAKIDHKRIEMAA